VNNKERTKASMYGNSRSNVNRELTREEVDALIFEKKTSEYGFSHFEDPHVQTYFEHVEEEYRLRYKVREAYDGQELLRRMRADIKREYLTRKKQVKKLQLNAAVTFRNAESRLQEYYSETAAAELPTHFRAIDIGAPLVTVVELPHDRHFDLKDYNPKKCFEGLRELHTELSDSLRTKIRDHHREQWVASDQVSETSLDDNDSKSSYDSDYLYEFNQYPREYEWERQAREDEEARVAQASILRAEHEAEAAAEEAERRKRWDDMTLEEEERIWFENTRDVNAPWSDDGRDEEHNDNDNDTTEAVTIPEIAASGTGGVLCAKKKAIAAAGAAKARREKQQRKKDAAKFVPVILTMNTNRENAAAAADVLYVGRAQVNLPKNRNLNQVVARTQDEARKMKKRDAAKWKRLNTDLKQTAARGTKVATLPYPNHCYCYNSDN
jgi:hypothetical protein